MLARQNRLATGPHLHTSSENPHALVVHVTEVGDHEVKATLTVVLALERYAAREVVQGDILLWMDKGISFYLREKYDLIFMGPPFKLNLTGISLEVVCKHGLLGEEGWIICQHHIGEKAPERAGGTSFVLFRQEKYGKTMLSFYRHDK